MDMTLTALLWFDLVGCALLAVAIFVGLIPTIEGV